MHSSSTRPEHKRTKIANHYKPNTDIWDDNTRVINALLDEEVDNGVQEAPFSEIVTLND